MQNNNKKQLRENYITLGINYGLLQNMFVNSCCFKANKVHKNKTRRRLTSWQMSQKRNNFCTLESSVNIITNEKLERLQFLKYYF